MTSIKEILEYELLNVGEFTIQLTDILTILFIIIVTRLILWLIKKTLYRKHQTGKIDPGNVYAIFQILKYILWVIAFALALETIDIEITVLLAGSAALLVGVGLGLQQTFNDIVSGIILLSERSIRLNDILEVDGEIVKIKSIGLRTSTCSNRDEISIIIPNSLITTNKVINWSHQSKKARFKIDIGVAYGSDIELVVKTLEESAWMHPDISDKESIEVRLTNFGNSSIDFQVLFFTHNIFRIEKMKSDIRKVIHKKLTQNHITIPFPQLDLHLKKDK